MTGRVRLPDWLGFTFALAFASAVCIALLAARVRRTDQLTYTFMPWNLILAWIPLCFAVIAHGIGAGTQMRRIASLAVLPMWLLFFPNAPYVATDLLHLEDRGGVPLWFDAVMLFAFASTGLSLGLVSLYLMHDLIARMAGGLFGWLFALGSIGLAAFGIYLGRFMRYNSWDAVQDPLPLARYLIDVATHPAVHSDAYAVTAVLGSLIASAYFVLCTVARLELRCSARYMRNGTAMCCVSRRSALSF